MRRAGIIVLVAMLGVAALIGGLTGGSRAQDAPATPDPNDYEGEVLVEFLSHVDQKSDPANTLELVRITMGSGGVIKEHLHPGAATIYVSQGSMVVNVEEGETDAARRYREANPAVELGQPGDAEVRRGATDTVEPCESPCEFSLGEGDSLTQTGFTTMIVRVPTPTATPAAMASISMLQPGGSTEIHGAGTAGGKHLMGCDKAC